MARWQGKMESRPVGQHQMEPNCPRKAPQERVFVKRATTLILLGLAAGAGGWIAYAADLPGRLFGTRPTAGESHPASASATEKQNIHAVGAMGRIQPAEGIVRVAALTGERLGELVVHEGQKVERGAPLAHLDSRTLRKIEAEGLESRIAEAAERRDAEGKLAEAKIVAAEAAVAQVEAQQADIDAQSDKIELLVANLAAAEKDAERLAGLSAELASEREREQQALAVQQAKAELLAARSLLKKLTVGRDVGLAAAKADLEAARAAKAQTLSQIPLASLNKQLDLAKETLARTTIIAPTAGTILKVHAREGELMGQSPILELANLDRLVVVAEVYESDVKRIAPGQKAKIASRAFPPPADREGLSGTVARIGQMVSAAGITSLDPTAAVDRRVVEVRIELDEANSRLAANWIGLQVDVEFTPAATTGDEKPSER
jgi:HlyD family secretion protein